MKAETPTFLTEAALCQAFIAGVSPDWIVYPETAGWDILLVHRAGGWQIGIEAKLTLNAKVLEQAIRGRERSRQGPDFRAVLVAKVVAENAALARALGLTVITPKSLPRWNEWAARYEKQGPKIPAFHPDLPEAKALIRIGEWWSHWHEDFDWLDQFPEARCHLPDYIPEVAAGIPAPMVLSDWKIKAMRICIWVEKRGQITRAIFRDLGIDPSRWMTGHWLKAGAERGVWIAGPGFPADQIRQEHPNIFAKVEADFAEWSQKVGVMR